MKFTMQIDCDNAAFDKDCRTELARIIRFVAMSLKHTGRRDGKCIDQNGNGVGGWEITDF